VVPTPVASGTRSASIPYANLAPFNAQSAFSSSLNLQKPINLSTNIFLHPMPVGSLWGAAYRSSPQLSAVSMNVGHPFNAIQ
jgi:hypothetical protein